MASGDLIVKVADKDTLDRTYANTKTLYWQQSGKM